MKREDVKREKMKREKMKREDVTRDLGWCAWIAVAVLVTFHVSRFTRDVSRFTATAALAAASPEDVFRSISEDSGRPEAGGHATALLLCAAGGLILLLLLATRAGRRAAAPQPLNHSRKLMREVLRSVPLRRAELKQLRLIADAAGTAPGGEPVQSPLTLLLCPSVLARALKNGPAKVDRAVIARVVKKMNLVPQSQ
jgi:hypothetical protein